MLLPDVGWLVDAEHSNTVAYLHRNWPAAVLAEGLRQVTVAELRGESRSVTSHLAEMMACCRLQDQTRPIGLLYGSKLGSDWDFPAADRFHTVTGLMPTASIADSGVA
ncbi:hypothetical protein [Mycolicibacterium llatzerense]|uniref:hypothetical protein n=1 Tax=Mycolicibacterium llatzerense TaxID=280871 RepID=UPI0013A6E3C3|nr:hypothetical protein [Mycolicibacterium llatzerense]